MRYEDDKIVVVFDKVGHKTMSTAMVLVERLLRHAKPESTFVSHLPSCRSLNIHLLKDGNSPSSLKS
jgi:hypothetical protein